MSILISWSKGWKNNPNLLDKSPMIMWWSMFLENIATFFSLTVSLPVLYLISLKQWFSYQILIISYFWVYILCTLPNGIISLALQLSQFLCLFLLYLANVLCTMSALYYVPHLATVLMTIIKQIPTKSYPLSLLMWIFLSNRYLPNLPALLQELYYISIFKMAFPKLTEVL